MDLRDTGVLQTQQRYSIEISGVRQVCEVTVSYCGSYERPPCAEEHAARPERATVRSPKSVAFPTDAMVI